jgi:glutamate formiminotransferase/formiminotetrahydrofolate cyclodeaminase
VRPIVECVPNFSEGRRPEIIQAITEAAASVPGVHVLDVQSDVDHNRSVVTLIGPPEAVEEAAFRSTACAAERINLDQHQGAHPRIGAADVVPFIPISGVTMEECVLLARRLGQRVGEELSIPVYLYEAAATRPERINLADVRRGEYEGLKVEIETDPARAPDFGPAKLGPAGATVIGARPFLVAFNVYLNTDDVSIAKRIARAVRHSSGGLRHVKALGLLVEGVNGRKQAQVSMNLTDFRRTPIHRVVEMIRSEAAQSGVAVTHSELVGLAPQAALLDAACWYLQLDLAPEQVLENRLAAAEPDVTPKSQIPNLKSQIRFLDAVAADTPAPGGGSVAALAGALAAALAAMVGRLTLGKPKYAEVEAEMEPLVAEAERLRQALTARIAEDTAAFEAVMAAYRLPRRTDEEKAARKAAIQAALAQAAKVPLATARDAVAALELAHTAARAGNANAITDAGTAAWMARAAVAGAALNVRINAVALDDREQAAAWLAELAELEHRAEVLVAEVQAIVEERGGFRP